MIKGSIIQEDIRILNVNALNKRASQHKNHSLIELKREIDASMNIVRDTILLIIDRTVERKLVKRQKP